MVLNFSGVPNLLFHKTNAEGEGLNPNRGAAIRITEDGLLVRYLNIGPSNFTSFEPDTDDILVTAQVLQSQEEDVRPVCPVLGLPDGATIVAAIVYGNAGATAETWALHSTLYDGSTDVSIATANIGTEDTSVSGNGTIVDNSVYHYAFNIMSLIDTNDEIWGARVTYTA